MFSVQFTKMLEVLLETWPLKKMYISCTDPSCHNWFPDFLLVRHNSFTTAYPMNCQNKLVSHLGSVHKINIHLEATSPLEKLHKLQKLQKLQKLRKLQKLQNYKITKRQTNKQTNKETKNKETNKQRDIQIKRQRDRESGPATKYFSISGFHYFLPLNNLVYKYKVLYNRMYLETHLS